MKSKGIYAIYHVILFVVAVFLCSCSGDDNGGSPPVKLLASSQTITMVTDQNNCELKVTAEGPWQITGAASWLKVNPARGTGDATVKITAEQNYQKTERTCTLQLESAVTGVKYKVPITITQPPSLIVWDIMLSKGDVIIEQTGKFRITAKVYPENAANPKVLWISRDTTIATIDSTGLITGVKAGKTEVYAQATDGSGIKSGSCTVLVEYFYESVDLNLPSGTIWAIHNIGATSPLEPGFLYAWGDLNSYPSKKTNFTRETYSLYNNLTRKYKRYVLHDNYGTVDNLTALLDGDNAAKMVWGSQWTMPTKEQFDELIRNCSWEKTPSVSNVKGWKLTSLRNGKSIIFPLSGYVYNETFTASNGYYWTRELDTTSEERAGVLKLNTTTHSVENVSRYLGCSVRPVRVN